jgi:hypothetical protein
VLSVVSRDSPVPFEFKFSTPIPTSFKFGGLFTSPPQSGAPEYVRTKGRVSGMEKAQFTFELPPSAHKERNTPAQGLKASGIKDAKMDGLKKPDTSQLTSNGPSKTHKRGQSSPQLVPQDHRRENQADKSDRNTFTIVAHPEPKNKPLIHKSLPSKSQVITYHIDTANINTRTQQELPSEQLSQSFPTTSQDLPSTPSHRRTKSVVTPTRSSRRSKITNTYAEDSHREFIRDLRQLLGDKKLQREQEEREIDAQIQKLREEGKAIESTLAGEIPRLSELLARKVLPPSYLPLIFVY